MTVTLVVLALSVAAAVGSFALSAARSLPDPIDTTGEERVAVRWLARHHRLRRFLRQRLDRRTAGGLVLTLCLLVTFAVALVVGVVLDLISGSDWLSSADASVARWGAGHADSRAVGVLTGITHLGDTVVVIAAVAVAAVVDFVRRRRPDVLIFAVVVIGGEKLIVNGLKSIVNRERPAVLHLVEAVGSSFPSGHSGAAAVAWPAVALIVGRNLPRWTRTLLAGLAALIAVAVAASRALLGVHWLSDVVAGFAIGYGWFMITAVVFGGRAQRLGDPVTSRPVGTLTNPG